MKYLIFFLSFFLSTSASAQVELDTIPPYISIGSIPIAPLRVPEAVYYGGTTDVEMLLPHTAPYVSGTRGYIIQEYSKNADWVITSDPVVVIEGETKVIGVCQIIEDGRIRYGLTVEISDSEGTMLTIFPLPTSDNLLWEQLVQKQK